MKEETAMDKITTAMMEHICDELCKFSWGINDQEELGNICGGCEMGQYVSNILNAYNDLAGELKRAHKNALEMAGELLREKDKHQWIPVEDRLPEDGTYLCTLDGELCGLDEPFTGMCGIKNGRWDEDDCVIAWMPLPEPYRPPVSAEAGAPAGDYADNPTLAPGA